MMGLCFYLGKNTVGRLKKSKNLFFHQEIIQKIEFIDMIITKTPFVKAVTSKLLKHKDHKQVHMEHTEHKVLHKLVQEQRTLLFEEFAQFGICDRAPVYIW